MVTDPPEPASGEPVVFVSDESAEARHVSDALRARGYTVMEVALGDVVGRVGVQRPALIVCDVDAPRALDTMRRLRDVPGGAGVDVIFLGAPGRTLDEHIDAVLHEASGYFVRPVDPPAVVRKVEALIGGPSRPSSVSAPAPPRPSLLRATVPPLRGRGSRPSAAHESAAPESIRVESPVPSPHELATARPGPGPRSPAAPSPRRPAPYASAPSLTPEVVLADDAEPVSHSGELAAAALSPDLERMLAAAERRVGVAQASSHPPRGRLSPEEELDAVLPPELLASLDDPLDGDDADEDRDASAHGTRGGSEPGATGAGTAAGTTTGAGGYGRRETPAAHTPPPPPMGRGALPPEDEEPPPTPPARGTRPPTRPGTVADAPPSPREGLPSRPSLAVAREAPPSGATGRAPVVEPGPRFSSGGDAPAPAPAAAAPALAPPPPAVGPLELPPSLGAGDAVRSLARAVRARFSGALAFEDTLGIRRVVLRDGDFVTCASSVEAESLVSFLTQRGDLTPEAARQLGRKLPPFGRHAGAALVANGHLRQDDLWAVLRAHAEWVLGRAAAIERGAVSVEAAVPARLQSEPAVFGGATGAEILVEIVKRVVSPEAAVARLGGPRARLGEGKGAHLLGECALVEPELGWSARVRGASVQQALELTSPEFAATLLALVDLGVLETLAAPPSDAAAPGPPVADPIDDDALRLRIEARHALVEEGDYFALLGVPRAATSYEIRRAYLELRRELDPARLTARTVDLRDRVDTILEVLDEAYEILHDQLRRDRYRRALEAHPAAP
ncbi:MAG: hypothetical protein IT376_13460 [Polyangiaceae bacterium]|nr:hypothetical protein [Polyangiaceae bacterium]